MKPHWHSLIPGELFAKTNLLVEELEKVRLDFQLSHEEFAVAVLHTPAAVRSNLESIENVMLTSYGMSDPKQRWEMMLVARLGSKIQEPGKGSPIGKIFVPPQAGEEMRRFIEEINQTVSRFHSFHDVVSYVFEQEGLEGRFDDPKGHLRTINDLLESSST